MLAVGLLCRAGEAAAETNRSRPYTLDLMAATERLGAAQFIGGGDLLFERCAVYAIIFDECRSRIFLNRAASGSIAPLFDQEDGMDYRILSVSPDGRLIAYVRNDGQQRRVALFDRCTGQLRESGIVIASQGPAPWLAPRKLLILNAHRVDTSQTQGVQVFRSGRDRAAVGSTTQMVIWDADTNAHQALLPGEFWNVAPASQADRLAIVRLRLTEPADGPVLWNPERRYRAELFIIAQGSDGGYAARPVCTHCTVLRNALAWAPDGERLAYFATPPGRPWSEGRVHVYDLRTRRATPLDTGGLDLFGDGGESPLPDLPLAWIGQDPIVRATSRAGQGWYQLSRRAPERLPRLPPDLTLVAYGRVGAFLRSERGLWRVDASGNLERLPIALAAAERTRIAPTSAGVVIESSAPQAVTRVFLDPRSGRLSQLPSAPGEFRAYDLASESLALATEDQGETALSRITGDGSLRVVTRLNAHLRGVLPGTAVRLQYPGANAVPLTSWLLLPPGYEPADGPLPTIVHVYPGLAFGNHPYEFDLPDGAQMYRPELLLGHGYAVLLAGAPLGGPLPRNVIDQLLDPVSRAIARAEELGYVDTRRLAIQGHSYGGYGAAALITRTNRFRAAVAANGGYDLLSKYGTFARMDRRRGHIEGLVAPIVTWSEGAGGQGGMGAPPWQRPDAYIANSPLFSVENIETPLMLVHGDRDESVPVEQAEEMFTALYRLNKEAVFVRYPHEAHAILLQANLVDYWQRVFAWYERFLGPPFDVDDALAPNGAQAR